MPAVIKLAGIGDAIDRPMATYSSGQGARLRFAIAAAANPDILLIDEALGTGDAAFAARSKRTIDELRGKAGTIFLVSHAAQTVERMCTRAIWLHDGELITDGPAVDVARAYRWWAHNVAQENQEAADDLLARARVRAWT
jgi:teichoic acid transport system ATP-binding protein